MSLTQEQAIAMASARMRLQKPAPSTEEDQDATGLTKEEMDQRGLTGLTKLAEMPQSSIVSEDNYLLDQARAGAADFVLSMIPDRFLGIDGLSDEYLDKETLEFDREKYDRDLAEAQATVREEFFSYQGVMPESMTERYLGAGARGTVAEGPLALIGAKGPVSAATELMYTYVASTLGAISGDQAERIAESLGLGETWQGIARTFASTTAGVGASAARAPLTVATDRAQNAWKSRREALENVEAGAERLAMNDIDGLLKAASEADPKLEDFIEKTVELQRRVPGLIIPPGAAMANNPIIIKNLDSLLKTNPAFLADMRLMVEDAAVAVKAFKEKRYGEGGERLDLKMKAAAQAERVKLKPVEKKIDAIDARVESQLQKLSSGRDLSDVGSSVKNLMKAKESAVREKLKPEYNRVLSKAEADGVQLPPASVERLYTTAVAQKLNDVFGVEPQLARKFQEVFSPKMEKSQSPILDQFGNALPEKSALVFSSANVRQIDSLKRNLNKAIRKTSDPDAERKLIGFKKEFYREISKIPGDFPDKYRAVDLRFYEELGIPKKSAGIKQLDAARFESRAGAFLAKPEQARDFLAFVGEDGIPVVRDAILLKLESAAFSDGTFNTAKLDKFLRNRDNQRLIELVPGLRGELVQSGTAVKDMLSRRAKLNSDYLEKAHELSEGFFKDVHNMRFSDVISSILRSPSVSARYEKDLKDYAPETSAMLKQGIRSGMIDAATRQEGASVAEFIDEHKNAFDTWFGPRYIDDVMVIADASDTMAKINLKERFASTMRNEDISKRVTGIPFGQWASLARDRITSVWTKFAIAGSKITTEKAAAKRDAHLMEMLSSPEKLKAIANEVRSHQSAKKSLEDVAADQLGPMADKINQLIFKGAYFGVAGQEALEEAEKEAEL